MTIRGLHHVAYRCRDAKETVDFYTNLLGVDFNIAVAENYVPSTGEWSPHIHIFFQMADGSFLAFFEVPESPDMALDPNTPDWVQHLALSVADEKTLLDYKERLQKGGVEVVGPTDHSLCKSIYFFDPNGHRLELAVDTSNSDMLTRLRARSIPVLTEWSRTRRAPDVDTIHENAR